MRLINRIIPGEYRYPTITPFTIPDGHTYLKTLEILVWRMKQIIDEIDENNVEILDLVVDVLNTKIDEINDAFTEFEGEVDDKLASVDTKISDLETFVNTEISTLVTYVNDSVQQIINNSVEVQDPVVSQLVDDPDSATSSALNRYDTKRSKRVDVRDFADALGVIGSASIQAAIDHLSQIIIDSQMEDGGVVYIPAGTYELDTTITQPPHVHVHTDGTVIFLTNIPNGSAWHITPDPDAPNNISGNKISKIQWNWAALMSATGGAFIFKNVGARASSVALELGTRERVTVFHAVARYSIDDVSIENYHIGVKWNAIDHYMTTFNRIMIELVDRCVVYGDNELMVNSGEKVVWYDSLFASTARPSQGTNGVCHDILGPTVSLDFFGCSFDFVDDVFRFGDVTSGAQSVNVWGGHIEGVEGKIVTAPSPSPSGIPPQVSLMNVPFVDLHMKEMFSGAMKLNLEMAYRSTVAPSEPVWLIADDVQVHKCSVIREGNTIPRSAKTLNLVKPVFDVDGWVYQQSNATRNIVDGVLEIDITTGPGWARADSKKIACRAGDVVYVTASVLRPDSSTQTNARVVWYDVDGGIISNSPERGFAPVDYGEFIEPRYGFEHQAPAGATSFIVRYAASSTNVQSGIKIGSPEVYIL